MATSAPPILPAAVLSGRHAAVEDVAAGGTANAFIKGTDDASVLYTRLSIRPGVVDGKNYRKAFTSEIEVPAGNRVVDLYINAQFGFNEMAYQGRIPFQAKLAPGRRYVTQGRIAGRNVDVWIADAATRKPASKILSITVERYYIRLACPEPRFAIRARL